MIKHLNGKSLVLVAAALIGFISLPAQSKDIVVSYTFDEKGVVPYVMDGRKAITTSGSGLCWRTSSWSPALIETAVGARFPVGCDCDKDMIPADKCKVADLPPIAPAK